jgi:hypothetical protein
MARRFAEETSVPVARSRGEIDALLRGWGATGIQWTDDFANNRVTVRFAWPHEGATYMARFGIKLPSRDDLAAKCTHARTGKLREAYLAKLMEARGKREHRLLLLWLKAALNAVEAGVVEATTLFLPFLEGKTGRTVAEEAVPRLQILGTSSAARLFLPE